MLTLIMAGGVGERFWPLSRRARPKQVLDLTGRGSMIRLTVDRLDGLCDPSEILVVTNHAQRDVVLAELGGSVPPENVVPEPVGRNTAACIALAARLFRARGRDDAMLVLPADHLVDPVEGFQDAVRAAARHVDDRGGLVTFGIPPTRPETGYGYVRAGAEAAVVDGIRILRAEAFLEKPSAGRAREFVDTGGYYWNSGMFLWRVDTILDEIARHLPDLAEAMDGVEAWDGTPGGAGVLKRAYGRAPSVSIDYGVMEKASDVFVVEAPFRWNDVGSWEFVRDAHPPDGDGNSLVGDHVLVDARGVTVFSPERLVAVLGVDDVVVVDGGDTILVCARDRVQEVKRIVRELHERHRDDLL